MSVGEQAKWVSQLIKYREDLQSKGYNVIYIGLYGSQNYNLHDEDSDLDARAVVLPSVRQLLENGKVSKVYDYETGQVDVKDIISFMKTISKGNPAYIECATTETWIGDLKFRELIKDYKWNPRAVVGMMQEKYKGIEKELPKSSPMIAKIGYDPKQFHHIVRLAYLLHGKSVFHGEDREIMLNVKRKGFGPAHTVLELANNMIEGSLETASTMSFKAEPLSDAIYEYAEREMFRIMEGGK